jgi:hypothetical protein
MKVKPTYANVVSTLALFAALGGSAYAATAINGHQIMNGTITGAKLKSHTLTGKQINLKKLGVVPSATAAKSAGTATTAATATNAQELGGTPASGYALASSFESLGPVTLTANGTKILYQIGPFTLTANCTSESIGNSIESVAVVTIITTQGNSQISHPGGTTAVLTPGTPADLVVGAGPIGGDGGGAPASPVTSYELLSPDGTFMSGIVWVAVTALSPETCEFGGQAQVGG